ncbi:hypothetical protein [Cohnella panacarvi]|uniref:hypothetical protein n=1 Tax=Cohnella panacarvi TaxID=400776 RepID=UPI00047B0D90|nr:hypothetical protein [Cohnella panacarvi]
MKFRHFSRISVAALLIVPLLTLSGCLYPDDQPPRGDASSREAVLTVQDAVDRYYEQTGVLPIENADEFTPLYEKYKIDLGKLQSGDYLGSVPRIAFEKGGRFRFLIIDEETKPQVKLLDLPVYQQVGEVQKKVVEYFASHKGVIPAGEQMYPGYVSVDFDKLGIDAPDIRSVYSRQPVNLIMDISGKVYIDYGIDIMTAIGKSETSPDGDSDLRRYLIDASYYVPVKAAEYRWVDDAPQAVDPFSAS